MSAGFSSVTVPCHAQAIELKKLILKLRWIGREDDADALLCELGSLVPSEIVPLAPQDTD